MCGVKEMVVIQKSRKTLLLHTESMPIFTPELILACHNKGVEYLLIQDISALNF
jgi:hypothetical protein